MAIKQWTAGVAAAALVLAPTIASAQSVPGGQARVAPISGVEPAGESVEGSELRGGGIFVALLAAIAVILGIIIAIDEDDEPHPISK